MKINRIYGIVLRHLYLFKTSLDRLSDVFYWPAIDVVLFGLTSVFITRLGNLGGVPIITFILSGVLLWIIFWKGQYEITINLLEEIWNRNMINIFVAPLKFSEWIASLLILGILKAIVSLSFASLLAYLLYKVQLFNLGFYLIPFAFSLIMSGWVMGFLIAGLILRLGTRIQTFAWTTTWLLAPFSAVYYPITILPVWAQKVAAFVPTSYIFEGMREVITTGAIDPAKFYMSFLLNILYLVLSIIFLKRSFDRVLQKGLVSLY